MKRIFPYIFLALVVSNCKSKKSYSNSKTTQTRTIAVNTSIPAPEEAKPIIDYAKSFEGTRYKYGGTSKRGMDCSGLIYTSFKNHDIHLPRTTEGLKSIGSWVDLKEVTIGDLVFFATRKNSRNVNHVGIVTATRTGNIEFIHASTSKGVIISSLAERYWYFAFVQARRIL